MEYSLFDYFNGKNNFKNKIDSSDTIVSSALAMTSDLPNI